MRACKLSTKEEEALLPFLFGNTITDARTIAETTQRDTLYWTKRSVRPK